MSAIHCRAHACVLALLFTLAPGQLEAASSSPLLLSNGLGPLVQPASDEAESTRTRLKMPAGMKAEIWATHPLLADPVAVSFDRRGRLYVSEHHRNRHGTEDNREHRYWLEDDFAARTVEDRLAFMKK